MVGAIIGDLAAWTWENSHSEFYPKLVSKDASPSAYGRFLIKVAEALVKNPHCNPHKWVLELDHIPMQQSILIAIVLGWLYPKIQETVKDLHAYTLPNSKEELLANQYLAQIIFALRHGATKNDAAQVTVNGITFCSLTKNKKWQSDKGSIGSLVRSWIAFYDSYDFGSAMHNAVKPSGDRHFKAMLVGALADAMYGCEYYLIKKKYGESHLLELPQCVSKAMYNIHKQNRTFFPKNNAMTNVERHKWIDSSNPFADKIISSELYRRIVKAMYTGWENRYGFYLDDGWEYVYRSFCLLCRFQLGKQDNGTYRIVHYQKSDTGLEIKDNALEEALYSVEYDWFMYSGEINKRTI